MKIVAAVGSVPATVHTLIVPVFQTDRGPRIHPDAENEIPATMSGVLATETFRGAPGDRAIAHAGGDEPFTRIAYVGLGPETSLDAGASRRLGAMVGRLLYAEPRATSVLVPRTKSLDESTSAAALAEGLVTGRYQFDRFLSEKPKAKGDPPVHLVASAKAKRAAITQAIARGTALGGAINVARETGDLPPNELGPEELAKRARTEGRKAGLTVKVLTETALQKEKMGALLSVAKGSSRPARLIVLEHAPPRKTKEAPLVFVGKAITFDTGGISLKGREGMEAMKYDLGGGAAVLGALLAAGRLKVNRRVVGIIAAAENMPGHSATRPGDIVTAASGKSIEIINTDAEGRLVLADALHYAKRYKPALTVDLATLTGAAVVALRHYAGVFTRDDALRERVLGAAKRADERMWPLPIDDDFVAEMKGHHSDLRNSAGRAGGASLAAAFLSQFAPEKWVHVDVAPTAAVDRDLPTQARGGTGFGVRTLVELAESSA